MAQAVVQPIAVAQGSGSQAPPQSLDANQWEQWLQDQLFYWLGNPNPNTPLPNPPQPQAAGLVGFITIVLVIAALTALLGRRIGVWVPWMALLIYGFAHMATVTNFADAVVNLMRRVQTL